MRRNRIRLGRRPKGGLYAASALLFATGASWLIDRAWPGGHDFGAATSPLGPWLMKVHGAAAMIFLVLLGMLLEGHVRQAWGTRRSRTTGAIMVGGCAFLGVSGYGLYYLGGETAREVTSLLHWALGLLAPLLLLAHLRAGRRMRGPRSLRQRRASGRGSASTASGETVDPRAA